MEIAKTISKFSFAKRAKVGCIIVKKGRIISTGYNGMPTSMSNACEDEVKFEDSRPVIGGALLKSITTELITKPEVIHAEMNAIANAARNGLAINKCSMYLTMAPCINCAKIVLQSGIKELIYLDEYRNIDGINFLKQFIKIKKL